MKHYESLRSHFIAEQNSHEFSLPRTLALFMSKGFAASMKALCCEESFERSKQSYQVDTSERTEGLSGLQANLVSLLSNMIENQINSR